MKIFLFLLLASAATGIELGCRYVWFTYVGTVIDSYYTCMVETVDFSDNSTHITQVNGTQLQIVQTQMIYFGGYFSPSCQEFNLDYVPPGGQEIFPNLIGLAFENCPINHLNDNDLEPYPNLEVFMSEHLETARIPGNFFDPTPSMQYVSFRGSGLYHVGQNFLSGLNSLWHLRFYGNPCISREADNSTVLINELIEDIRAQCPDNAETTTAEPTLEPTPPEPPRCEIDDLTDFVCRHDEEIEELKATVEDLQNQINELKELLNPPQRKLIKSKPLVEPLRKEIKEEKIHGKSLNQGHETIILEDENHIRVIYTPGS